MVKEKEVAKRDINFKDQIFDSRAFAKGVKEKLEDLGYLFIEKEQKKEDTKYGYDRKFILFGEKKYDDFGKAEITVTASFENVNKVKENGKEMEKGDAVIAISGKTFTDYRNIWVTSSFKKVMFNIYTAYFIRDRVKKLYTIPTIIDTNEVAKAAKDKLGLYSKY